MTLGEIIKEYRQKNNLSQRRFALMCGISNGYISMLEDEKNPKTGGPIIPSILTMKKLAAAMGMSLNELMTSAQDMNVSLDPSLDIQLFSNEQETRPKSRSVKIPVYGTVAAGAPRDAVTDIEDYEEIPESLACTGEYAALRINGNSMLPRFAIGDVVIVRLQEDVDSGDVAIVMVGDGEATCKKIKKTRDGVILVSTNPEYEPMFFTNKQIREEPVRIWGKVVELRAKF